MLFSRLICSCFRYSASDYLQVIILFRWHIHHMCSTIFLFAQLNSQACFSIWVGFHKDAWTGPLSHSDDAWEHSGWCFLICILARFLPNPTYFFCRYAFVTNTPTEINRYHYEQIAVWQCLLTVMALFGTCMSLWILFLLCDFGLLCGDVSARKNLLSIESNRYYFNRYVISMPPFFCW